MVRRKARVEATGKSCALLSSPFLSHPALAVRVKKTTGDESFDFWFQELFQNAFSKVSFELKCEVNKSLSPAHSS